MKNSRLFLFVIGCFLYNLFTWLELLKNEFTIQQLAKTTGWNWLDVFAQSSREYLAINILHPNHLALICFGLSVCFLFLGYSGLIHSQQKISLYIIAGVWGLMLFSYPALSSDVFDYNNHNSLFFTYGINPYVNSASVLANEHSVYLGSWYWRPAAYPIVSLLCYVPTYIFARFNIFLGILAYRFLNLIFILLSFIAIKKLLAKENFLPQLFLLNPLILIEGLGNIHNDIIMMMFFLWGLWFWKKQSFLISGILVALSIFAKIATIFALIYMLLELVVKKTHNFLLFIASVTISLLAILVIFFRENIGLLSTLIDQNNQYYFSFPGLIYHFTRVFTWSSTTISSLQLLKWMLFVSLIFWSIYSFKSLIERVTVALSAYLLFFSAMLQPWYLLWLLFLSPLLMLTKTFTKNKNIKKRFIHPYLLFCLPLSTYIIRQTSYYFSHKLILWEVFGFAVFGLTLSWLLLGLREYNLNKFNKIST